MTRLDPATAAAAAKVLVKQDNKIKDLQGQLAVLEAENERLRGTMEATKGQFARIIALVKEGRTTQATLADICHTALLHLTTIEALKGAGGSSGGCSQCELDR